MTLSFFQRLAAALVSRPAFYDLVQRLAGQDIVTRRLRELIVPLPRRLALDVGSSTGVVASKLGIDPVCLDLDVPPLVALRRSGRFLRMAAGDASCLPFRENLFDLTLCLMVFHHVDDETLERVIAELARVTSGHLLFGEPLLNESRAISRFLWRYDRGRHPRSRETLIAKLERRFQLLEIVDFAVYHQYLFCVARPLLSGGTPPQRGADSTASMTRDCSVSSSDV